MRSSQIRSYDEIKGYAAQTGFTLFGIRHGIEVPDRREVLERGIAICEVVEQGKRLLDSDPVSFDDRALRQEFMSFAERKKVSPEKVATIAVDAPTIGAVLRDLGDDKPVSPSAIESAILFFRQLYSFT
jgi:hypothetical protein